MYIQNKNHNLRRIIVLGSVDFHEFCTSKSDTICFCNFSLLGGFVFLHSKENKEQITTGTLSRLFINLSKVIPDLKEVKQVKGRDVLHHNTVGKRKLVVKFPNTDIRNGNIKKEINIDPHNLQTRLIYPRDSQTAATLSKVSAQRSDGINVTSTGDETSITSFAIKETTHSIR